MGAREIAYSVLVEYKQSGTDVSALLDRAINDEKPGALDRSLATELVYGCMRYKLALEWLVGHYSRFRLPAEIKVLIGLGMYQLLCLDRVPDYAAVNESVRLAKAIGKRRWASSVNAILRKVQAEREHLPWPRREEDIKHFLEIRYSHPAWLVDTLMRDHGPDHAEEILKINNERPPITIRCNTLKVVPSELRSRLEQEGIIVEPTAESDLFFNIKSDLSLADIPSFQEGLFTVQDVSARYAVEMLGPRPGESILDLCAGPGGKTTYIAQLMGDVGEICAIDISSDKISMIRESCERLGIRSVQCLAGDGRHIGELCGQSRFDRVLVDAPCSNTGVLRRRVEARWRMVPSKVEARSILQLSLLRAAAGCLKEGGAIVYSTCSILREENDAVVTKFLAEDGGNLSHALLKLQGSYSGDGIYSALIHLEGR